MAQRRTLLDDLNGLLSDDAFMQQLHQRVLYDERTRRTGLTPTLVQVRAFLTYIRDGAQYATTMRDPFSRRICGDDVLPARILFDEWKLRLNGDRAYGFCDYTPKFDRVDISYYFIALVCSRYSDQPNPIFPSRHFHPAGHKNNYRVSGEVFTFLAGVEECYHRFQHYALGFTMQDMYDAAALGDPAVYHHSMERMLFLVYRRAMHDNQLTLYVRSGNVIVPARVHPDLPHLAGERSSPGCVWIGQGSYHQRLSRC